MPTQYINWVGFLLQKMIAHTSYRIRITHNHGYSAKQGIASPQIKEEIFDFRVRCITRHEYQLWSTNGDEVEFEDLLLKNVVLEHPQHFHGSIWNWDDVYAGIVDRVKQEILRLSGFLGDPHPMLIERVDKYLKGQDAKYDLMIMLAFPHYGLEDLINMDNETWHKISGLAQDALVINGLDPDMIIAPEKFEKKQKMAGMNAPPPSIQGMPGQNTHREIRSEAAMSFTS